MLQQLEMYISAQKTIGNYSMALGIFMVVLAVLFHFIDANPLFNGLKIGMLVVGLITLGSGYSYRIAEEKILQKQTALYQKDPAQFHQVEKARMEKVVRNIPYYLIGFIAVIIALLMVIFFTKNSFVHDILFFVILFALGSMIIEKVSKTSIETYYEQLLGS
ncbi:MAG: hypothetical protein OHK0039_47260 [Bacteroidia bacterium]